MSETYTLGSHTFRSRLIVGSGKYASLEQTRSCTEASGADMITVALRRVDLTAPKGERLQDFIPEGVTILPNTAGCYNVEDAVTTAKLGRELLGHNLVKLEVIGDERTLFPDARGTLDAAQILLDDGFEVLPYVSDDPVACQRLAEDGLPRGHAARRAHRVGSRHPQPGQPADHPRDGGGARRSSTPASAPPATPPSPWSSARPPS